MKIKAKTTLVCLKDRMVEYDKEIKQLETEIIIIEGHQEELEKEIFRYELKKREEELEAELAYLRERYEAREETKS